MTMQLNVAGSDFRKSLKAITQVGFDRVVQEAQKGSVNPNPRLEQGFPLLCAYSRITNNA